MIEHRKMDTKTKQNKKPYFHNSILYGVYDFLKTGLFFSTYFIVFITALIIRDICHIGHKSDLEAGTSLCDFEKPYLP